MEQQTVVATIENGEPVVITMRAPEPPSVVAFAKDGGERDWPLSDKPSTNADRTMISVKRHMGTKFTDVDETTTPLKKSRRSSCRS